MQGFPLSSPRRSRGLEAARAYEHAGILIAGVATTGAAARVMSEAGIPARTVERALIDREQAPAQASVPRPASCSWTKPARSAPTPSPASPKPSRKLTPLAVSLQKSQAVTGACLAGRVKLARPANSRAGFGSPRTRLVGLSSRGGAGGAIGDGACAGAGAACRRADTPSHPPSLRAESRVKLRKPTARTGRILGQYLWDDGASAA